MADKPPIEVAERFRRRNRFVFYAILFMTLMSVVTWFVLPNVTKLPQELTAHTRSGPGAAALAIAGWFKAFWVVCVIVSVGLCVLAKMGVLDPLLPLLNLLLVVAGAGAVGLCLYCYYAPLASLDLTPK